MKKYIFFLIPLLFINTVYSQVLYEETFDNLTTGDLAPNGATPGQGGWYVTLTSFGEAKVVPEPTKGKVLSAEVDFGGGMHCKQTNIQPIWGNRTAGNNILLLEYDFYAPDLGNIGHVSRFVVGGVSVNGGGMPVNSTLIDMILTTEYDAVLQTKETELYLFSGQSYKNINYEELWFTVKFYVDYNTNKLYLHIPALGILHGYSYTTTLGDISQFSIASGISDAYTGAFHKYDNVRLTALKSLPTELLSTNNFLSEKFNLYPNPASNVVNITNNENRLVNQVAIYDTAGKLIKTQSFNDQTELRLNIENFASGTYLLHLQTAEGTAVKKLVKE